MKVIAVGVATTTGGAPIVSTMVALIEVGELAGEGTMPDAVYVIVRVSPTTTVDGSGMVTIRPVASTVGETVVSLEVTAKVVPAENAEPAGDSVPVNTIVLPGSEGRRAILFLLFECDCGGRWGCALVNLPQYKGLLLRLMENFFQQFCLFVNFMRWVLVRMAALVVLNVQIVGRA